MKNTINKEKEATHPKIYHSSHQQNKKIPTTCTPVGVRTPLDSISFPE
jgi:hypothetical protein